MRFEPALTNARTYTPKVPVVLPLNVLLAIPDYVSGDPAAPVFNLPMAIGRLLGKFGWERASRVLRPWIWAPGWSRDELGRFATSPFGGTSALFAGAPLATISTPDFPGTGALRDLNRRDFPHFEIVHLTGAVAWEDGERVVVLSRSVSGSLAAQALRDALWTARARLLIWQVPADQHDEASAVCDLVVIAGGPASLVVSCSDPADASRYLMDVYAGIVHDQSLPTVAVPPGWLTPPTGRPEDDLRVTLHYDIRDVEVLRFGAYLAQLEQSLESISTTISNAQAALHDKTPLLRARAKGRVHQAQNGAIESTLATASSQLGQLAERADSVKRALQNDLNFAHESGGVEPLSRIAETTSALGEVAALAQQLPELVESAVSQIIDTAPRVVNANFTDPESRAVVNPFEGLVAGKAYELLVDVGPRWSKTASIVTGATVFPEEALPTDVSGYVVDVVFLSDDFSPGLVSEQMWVPRAHGRSYPWINGRQADKSGPISLRLTVPSVGDSRPSRRVNGRLLLYYENNLLQSALVTAGVVSAAGAPPISEANEIRVDYVLTSTFASVGPKFGKRSLRMSLDEGRRDHHIALNITLNHDGHGTHRIIARGSNDKALAWTAYDPAAAKESLRSARSAMLACFWSKSHDGNVLKDPRGEPLRGLDAHNGKPWDQFLVDLKLLAPVGNQLYDVMVNSVRPAESSDPITWEKQLRRTLDRSSVIQIARIDSTPTQYAFPWALLYEYPLPGAPLSWKFCQILWDEWSAQGLRDGSPATACKYQGESWHAENVLCPYGFWGLKHVIEQPLVPVSEDRTVPVSEDRTQLRDAVTQIHIGSQVTLSMGWTRDTALDLNSVDGHISQIARFGGVRLAQPPPNPAEDREGVRRLVTDADLVYFLCHCEKATIQNQPYLSLGVRDGNEGRKIYGSTITDWARTGLPAWRGHNPLVVINGCHTADIEPGEVLSLVSAFATAGASGVIGSDISVQLPVALEFGERLISSLVATSAMTVGEAVREVRWTLANKGNLLGLCYAEYGQADLAFVHDDNN